MSIFSLWLSIITFSVLTAGSITAWKSALLKRTPAQLLYASLLTAYDLWLVIYTFTLFNNIFIDKLSQQQIYLVGGLRTIFTVVILTLYLYLSLSKISRLSRFHIWLGVLTPTMIYLVVLITRFFSMTIAVLSVVSMGFSLVLLVASILGYLFSEYRYLKFLRRLYLITGSYELLMLIISIPSIISIDSHLVHVVPRALFCLALGISEISRFLYPRELEQEKISSEFLHTYRITKREKEILELLQQGLQVKQIAEHLFISPRTVETHITNIYTKCACRNRVELINCMQNKTDHRFT